MTAADRIASLLVEHGVRHVFGVSGANIEDLFAAARRRPELRVVLGKHEHSAGCMADGYARVSGRVGVVLATSGGGAMNLVPALAEARASRVPLLAIVGEPPREAQGRGVFQDTSERGPVDAVRVLGAASVFCARVRDAEELPDVLERALAATCRPIPGPAVVLVAKDVQCATATGAMSMLQARRSGTRKLTAGTSHGPHGAPGASLAAAARTLDPETLDRAAHALEGVTVIVAGDGISRGGARAELAALAEALDASVAVAPDARDAFDNGHPRFLGVAGVMGHAAVRRALAGAGAVLVAGTRLPLIVRQGLERELAGVAMVSVGPERPFVSPPDAVHLEGDVREELAALLARVRSSDARPHRGRERTVTSTPRQSPPASRALPSASFAGAARPGGDRLRSTTVLAALDRTIPDDAVVLVDAGNTGASAAHDLRAPRRGRWLLATGMAGMGYTFGAAVGAALASGTRVYVVAGDGAFLMHGLEIHTAVEHALPITYVLLNNDAHGMCLTRERLLLGQDSGCNRFRHARLGAGLAAMFPGLPAVDCRSSGELAAALASSPSGGDGPAVICAEVDAAEIPAFFPFDQALASAAGAPVTPGENDEDRRPCRAG